MHKSLNTLIAVVVGFVLLSCSSGTSQLKNDWTDSRPGTIFITGILSDIDFQAFYNQTLNGKDHYTIILNTDGGEAQACTGIINRIVELQKRGVTFTTVVYTKAYSAGSFIFMMGDYRIMHRGSQLMWHTIGGQAMRECKITPGAYGMDRENAIVQLDENVIRLTMEAYPNVDPMTLETMLRYSGMTFIAAWEANELGMVDELK